ncbi:unnamed protein product [Prunus armeniaca]
MSNLAWPLLCWRKKTRAAVVHEKAVPRMWTDIDILGKNCVGNLGLLPEQKFRAVIRMLAYRSSTDQVDEIARMRKFTILESLVDYLRRPTPRDLQRLLQKAKSRGFPGMIGSIDCMHWQWKNCPTAWSCRLSKRFERPGSIPEGYRKDVEKCFGILQARWAIITGATRLFDDEVLRSIMMTCIILHNMIVEDGYDYDADEVYEPDPMNTALTRIYEKPMGPMENQCSMICWLETVVSCIV